MIGLGTALNVVAVLAGSALGVALGGRLPGRTRDVVTDGLGLVTLLVAALSAAAVVDPALRDEVGSAAVLVVLGAVVLGGIAGSLLRVEDRLEGLGERIRRTATRRRTPGTGPAARPGTSRATGTGTGPTAHPGTGPASGDTSADGDPAGLDAETAAARRAAAAEQADEVAEAEHAAAVRFVDGFVTASLVFCVGPLAILGSLQDGLGRGIDQLALKSALDFFASMAFAATLGWGVAASALVVLVFQGAWTLLGWSLGGVLPEAQIAAITATGGLLLVAIALRLLRLRPIPVGDLLPALVVAPVIVALVTWLG